MASASDLPILYSYWRSSSAYRVRIALAHKEIAYQYKAVHLLKDGGEQKKDAYAAINPLKVVPTLQIDGHTLFESAAIIEYLEETRPSHPLLPKDPYQRHLVRQITLIIVADIQPKQNLSVMAKYSADPAARNEWAKHWITDGFEALEKVLARSAGKYCVGDEVSMADCVLVPQVYNARRYSVNMAAFPHITRIDAELCKLPAFQAAHPDAQPDAEKSA